MCETKEMLVPPWLEEYPGEGNGNLIQYSRLEKPMDRGAWWATAHTVLKSRTQLKQLSIGASCGPGWGQWFHQCLALADPHPR